MGQNSQIEWTHHTWNPWYGCQKVSPGCKHCYMYRDMNRYGMDPSTVKKSKSKFDFPLHLQPADPNQNKIFTCSWSDFFIEAADPFRDEAWDIIKQTPHLTYQILTKRPENIPDRLPEDWGEGYPNVWLGVSIETEVQRDRMIELIKIPASKRFLSLEPLLASVDLCLPGILPKDIRQRYTPVGFCIDWVIVGGESGPNRRPFDCDWARDILRQCQKYDIPFFMKQVDKVQPIPDDLFIREFPK